MEIKKKKDSYNVYTLEISYGQLEAFRAALQQNHADPLYDETLAELSWYMDRVPGPGEDEDEFDAQQKSAKEGAAESDAEGEDLPIPMPPGQKAGTPPPDAEEKAGPPSEEEMAGDEGADYGLPDADEEAEEPQAESPDERLPEPPAE